jgi:hypothetical protein
LPRVAARRADRCDRSGNAGAEPREIALGQLGEHFHLPGPGDPEKRPGARADDLPGLDIAIEKETGGRGTDVEAADARAALAEIGLCHPDPGVRGVAGGDSTLDVGLGNESA